MIALCHCQVLVCVWLCGSVDGVWRGGIYDGHGYGCIHVCVCVCVCLCVCVLASQLYF